MSSLKDLPITAKIGLFVGAGILGFIIYKKIKKKMNVLPQTFPLPTGGGGMPVVSYNPQGQPTFWNPEPLAKELFDVMDGLFTLSSTKDVKLYEFANLPTPDMATAVYNQFNKNYGDGETLTQWINDEWFTPAGSEAKNLALAKLQSLGLP